MNYRTRAVIILGPLTGLLIVSISSILLASAIVLPNSGFLSIINTASSILSEPTSSRLVINEMNSVDAVIAATTTYATPPKKLNIVTSISPIANIVKNVGGYKIDLTGLVPEGVNSHTFEFVPSDVIKINNADLVIMHGLGLDTNIEDIAKVAQTMNPKLEMLKLGDNTITPNQWIFDFSFPKEKGDPNPHLWLNVAYAMKFANLTRDKLIQLDPQNAQYYSDNTDRYISVLKKLDEGIMQAVQTVPPQNRKLLTYHDSWAYFASRYGITVMGAVQPSDFGEPNPQEVARIIDQTRSEKVSAIFASEVFSTRVINQIAEEGNVKVVETLSDDDLPGEQGDPEHTYVGMMLENIRNMLVPLGGNITALSDVDPTDTYAS